MKKFRNTYAAYLLLYSFYFMSTSLFTTLISVYLMGKHYNASQVSTLVSVAFFLSMIAQPFFGYINERFGIVKMTTLSLSAILGGVLGFLWAPNLFWLTVFYGIVLVCLNGTAPMMEVFATQSAYAFGKIRVWGTIGYSLGVQIAGWVYHQFSPQAVYYTVLLTIVLSIFCLSAVRMGNSKKREEKVKEPVSLRPLLHNRPYLFFIILIGLASGVGNIGHTYIQNLLMDNGLSVQTAATIVAISVVVEAPLIFFSDRFMDNWPLRVLIALPMGILCAQYAIYALPSPILLKVLVTLLAKHTTGMVLIMVSLRFIAQQVKGKDLVLAMAIVQGARYLGTILLQPLAAHFIEYGGYQLMSFFLAGVVGIVFVMTFVLKMPQGKVRSLFSGTVE
ncbi:MFS transporter [Streptococcus lactarius]|uniref:MFS transporter n=1 Tax=Streptococcus lactarius TaxID=684066 RepID=A0A9X0WM64_9STRE|nr:MFS transporter [Streptococcus lactarius]MBK4779190.1 MFS transporter [Streptococcus lactarius]QUB39568.1 MFS transporter [Streptococcus lactarius]